MFDATTALGTVVRQDENGVLRIGATRIPVETVIEAFQDGASAEEIAIRFDTLSLGEVYSALGEYLRQPVRYQAYLETRRQFTQTVRHEVEARQGKQAIRQRLLVRMSRGC